MTMYSHCMFMYDYPDWGFSVLFPQLWGKCQGKTRKDGARPALFLFFVLFYVFLCCSMYCLFFEVLCIVCVYMCTVLLPPGGYPIAVKYIISNHIISYHISYHIISYHIISYHIISYHIISYIISYHIISYHIISYSISYHITSYHIAYCKYAS